MTTEPEIIVRPYITSLGFARKVVADDTWPDTRFQHQWSWLPKGPWLDLEDLEGHQDGWAGYRRVIRHPQPPQPRTERVDPMTALHGRRIPVGHDSPIIGVTATSWPDGGVGYRMYLRDGGTVALEHNAEQRSIEVLMDRDGNN